jgi:hypothetical protein
MTGDWANGLGTPLQATFNKLNAINIDVEKNLSITSHQQTNKKEKDKNYYIWHQYFLLDLR